METCQTHREGFVRVKDLNVHTLNTHSWSLGLVGVMVSFLCQFGLGDRAQLFNKALI